MRVLKARLVEKNEEEREAAGRVLSPSYVKASLQRLREAPPPEREPASDEKEAGAKDGRRPRLTREALEAEQRDEDAIR